MNIACRFPIKPNLELLVLIGFCHLFVMFVSWQIIYSFWANSLVFVSLMISAYFSHRNYLRITSAIDDLCWTGDSWVMNDAQYGQGLRYMDLKVSSWITGHFCLLKFDHDGNEQSWIFSKKELGERAYRELCYLAKRNLNKIDKSNSWSEPAAMVWERLAKEQNGPIILGYLLL